MSYAGWNIAPHTIQPSLGNACVICYYFVVDENGKVFDRLNAVYDGDGNLAIYSNNEEEYVDPSLDDPYYDFVHDKLTVHRFLRDTIRFTKSPIGNDGIIRI